MEAARDAAGAFFGHLAEKSAGGGRLRRFGGAAAARAAGALRPLADGAPVGHGRGGRGRRRVLETPNRGGPRPRFARAPSRALPIAGAVADVRGDTSGSRALPARSPTRSSDRRRCVIERPRAAWRLSAAARAVARAARGGSLARRASTRRASTRRASTRTADGRRQGHRLRRRSRGATCQRRHAPPLARAVERRHGPLRATAAALQAVAGDAVPAGRLSCRDPPDTVARARALCAADRRPRRVRVHGRARRGPVEEGPSREQAQRSAALAPACRGGEALRVRRRRPPRRGNGKPPARGRTDPRSPRPCRRSWRRRRRTSAEARRRSWPARARRRPPSLTSSRPRWAFRRHDPGPLRVAEGRRRGLTAESAAAFSADGAVADGTGGEAAVARVGVGGGRRGGAQKRGDRVNATRDPNEDEK